MKHNVATYRSAGLEARWGKTGSGTPCIYVRNPNTKLKHQRESWWMVSRTMFDDMVKDGIVESFDRHTLIANVFSIAA